MTNIRQTIKRWYYIDMQMALDTNGDREEAVISLPEERQIKRFGRDVVKDYSTPKQEYEAMLFPLSKVFDSRKWRVGFERFWEYNEGENRTVERVRREDSHTLREVPSAGY